MLNDVLPSQGHLLVSEPFLPDPTFKRSVVLLTEHGEEGTMGFVLNQKSNALLKDIVPDLWESELPVYFGGPVGTDSLFFIHRCYEKLGSGEEIAKGIYWGGNFEALKILVNGNSIGETEIRFFIGYSGWESGQLQSELVQNSWIVTKNYQADLIFANNEEALWKDVIKNMGVKFAHLSNFPWDPSLN